MLILNGKKFAENDDEFINSLFTTGGTCVGYAKRNKRSVTLMNMQKEKIGVINKHGVLCHASKVDGKYWYSYMTIPEIGEWISYMQQCEETQAALNGANTANSDEQNNIVDCRSCSRYTGKFCSDVVKCRSGERFLRARPVQLFSDAIYNTINP